MKEEILQNHSTVVIGTRLRTVKIEKDITAYQSVSAFEIVDSVGDLKVDMDQRINTAVRQGFLDDKNLKLLKAGKAYKERQFTIMDADAREALRTRGWNDYWDERKTYPTINALAAADDPDSIVRLDPGSWMMFDRHNDALPIGLNFDYISHGGITDGRFDLKKLAAHLLARDDIWIYPCKTGWKSDQCDHKGRATKLEECITEIPYYNREKGCSQTIYFRWMPDVDSYRKMWSHCLASNTKYPSTHMFESIFELDLLGFRAAGCALFDEYHKSTRYDSSNDDDDE